MHSSRRLGQRAALAIASLALAGCASTNVSSYVARGTDFSQYQTYRWEVTGRFETGDPRLDNNPFFQERVQATAERQLAAKGFEKVTSGASELVLHYHASVEQKLNVNDADAQNGFCTDCEPYVYDAGTLVIDFVDARTNRLIWRGWAEGSVDGVIDNQQWMEERIDRAVARILEALPRRL
jgi:hypothetical protein